VSRRAHPIYKPVDGADMARIEANDSCHKYRAGWGMRFACRNPLTGKTTETVSETFICGKCDEPFELLMPEGASIELRCPHCDEWQLLVYEDSPCWKKWLTQDLRAYYDFIIAAIHAGVDPNAHVYSDEQIAKVARQLGGEA